MAAGQDRGTPKQGCTPATDPPSFIRRFQELVEARPRTGLPVGHYAAVLGVSESRLTSHCRRLTGRSPLQVINAAVMRRAREAMLSSRQSVSQIAFGLGFSEPTYFTRVFRRHTGMTPTDFRANAKRDPGGTPHRRKAAEARPARCVGDA